MEIVTLVMKRRLSFLFQFKYVIHEIDKSSSATYEFEGPIAELIEEKYEIVGIQVISCLNQDGEG